MKPFRTLFVLLLMLPAMALALPDLAISQIGYLSGTISAVVLNTGDVATPAGRSIGVAFYVDGTRRGSGLSAKSLEAGSPVTVSAKYQLPPGVHELAAEVDDLGLIAEADETNNWLRVPSSVQLPAPPAPTPNTLPASALAPASVIAAITADMGASDAAGHGIETWAPSKGGIVEYALPPGYGGMIGWGCVYRDTTDSQDTNTRVAIRELRAWLLDKSGKWTLVSSPANSRIFGDQYPENFHGSNAGNATRLEADGSLSQKLAHGFAWHFFSDARVPVDPANVAGVLTYFSARLVVDDPAQADDRATAKYLFASGGDWWRTLTAAHIAYNKDPALTNTAEIGWSKLKRVTNDWQTVRFTNIPAATLAKYPPPL